MTKINNYLLLLLAFFITTSVFMSDVIVMLFFLSWIASGNFKEKLKRIFFNPITSSIIIFISYFLLSFLWSDASIFNTTTKGQLLLILAPVLFTLSFDSSYVKGAKYIFIMGLFCNILLSIFTFINPNNLMFKDGHYDTEIFAHGFLDHFDYSIFLFFGIILIISLRLKKDYSFWWWTAALILVITLLNSYGRIGIMCLIIFVPIIIMFFQRSKIHYILLLIMFGSLIISYYIFPPFSQRVNTTVENIYLIKHPKSLSEKIDDDAEFLAKDTFLTKEHFLQEILKDEKKIQLIAQKKPEYETSIGQRYVYTKNSLKLIQKNPIFGYGGHQFYKIYNDYFSKQEIKKITQPHNNFIFILVELGAVGIILMLLIFFYQIKVYFQTKNWMQLIFPLFFLFIMLFDNYFLNHNTLLFFCFFTFIIYSDQHSRFNNDRLS